MSSEELVKTICLSEQAMKTRPFSSHNINVISYNKKIEEIKHLEIKKMTDGFDIKIPSTWKNIIIACLEIKETLSIFLNENKEIMNVAVLDQSMILLDTDQIEMINKFIQ
jgi:hypothetical protein